MKKEIYPCLWFDGQAKAAAEFYCYVFPNSRILSHGPLVTMWELYGQKFMGLDGGPFFKPNESISFFVTCETNAEVDDIWNELSINAKNTIPPSRYSFTDYYGFLTDQFGVSWQINKGNLSAMNQKIVPCFLFTDHNFGKANDAVHFYSSVFMDSKVDSIRMDHAQRMPGMKIVEYAQFVLNGSVFLAMDGPGKNNVCFNEAFSFVINCDTQEQIDYYWSTFTKDGGKEGNCGWCKDKFGVSWQIVPSILGELMNDPERSQRVTKAFMQMKKFDIEVLLKA
jgi:predicted 3-demethylubiquinone-9 3-methyltransferase (glyoxalase superfamily)